MFHNLLVWAASQPRQAGRWRLARRWRVPVSSFRCSSPHSLSRSPSRSTPPPPPSGTCACRLSNRALSPPRHHYTEPAQSGYRRPGHGWLHHRGPRLNLLYICPHDAPRSGAEPCMSGPHWIRWIILRSLFYTFLGFWPLRPPHSSICVKALMFRLNAPVAFFSFSSLRSC